MIKATCGWVILFSHPADFTVIDDRAHDALRANEEHRSHCLCGRCLGSRPLGAGSRRAKGRLGFSWSRAERYERGSVLITSNLPFSQWEAIFRDPMTTAAAIDRLVHHSVILELNLPSYRMEQAQAKRSSRGGKAKEATA